MLTVARRAVTHSKATALLISFYMESSSGQDEPIDAPVSANPPHVGDIVAVSSPDRRFVVTTVDGQFGRTDSEATIVRVYLTEQAAPPTRR